MKSKSYLEERLSGYIKCAISANGFKFQTPEREYRFDKTRHFRFDFAWPYRKLAIEVSGSIWVKGGHSSGKGLIRDADKNNLAVLDGWRVLQFTEWHINKDLAGTLDTIKKAYLSEAKKIKN